MRLLGLCSVAFALCSFVANAEECLYRRGDGSVATAASIALVPAAYKASAQCLSSDSGMVKPSEVDLKGNLRKELISTALGRVTLRWPRSVETIFGRSPINAMTDAMNAASRALKSTSFDPSIQSMFIDWDVVFMDENLPSYQIPQELVSNCHPGWMTPPGNIFIVAQRAAKQCSGGEVSKSEADARLAQVLIHEVGHAVEAKLLMTHPAPFDRMRAEGFASWFEQYATDYSGLIGRGKVRREYMEVARQVFAQTKSPYVQFQGRYEDYARASTLFGGIAESKSVRDLMKVYQVLGKFQGDLYAAVGQTVGWKPEALMTEAVKYAGK